MYHLNCVNRQKQQMTQKKQTSDGKKKHQMVQKTSDGQKITADGKKKHQMVKKNIRWQKNNIRC